MGKRKRLVWLGLAAAGAATAAWYAPEPDRLPEISAPTRPATGTSTTVKTETDRRFAALPERETLGKPRGNVFASQSWEPPPAPRRVAVVAPPAPVAPSAPPMPYRVAGKVVHEGGAHIVLAKGDRVVWVREGETLDDGYRVDAITPEHVTLTYMPLEIAQHLPVVSSLQADVPKATTAVAPAAQAVAPAGPAQLRFEGPREVRAGSPFNVALKVTSGRPVRASPLQLSFDAKLIEPVHVRAGGFFAGGSFTYRVSPSGSIFVGAAGKGAVPADAEFLVVTFKPIGSAGTAEIKLSSLILQDASGRAIVHDHPAAFRTAIVQ